jgi:hypothetical protein
MNDTDQFGTSLNEPTVGLIGHAPDSSPYLRIRLQKRHVETAGIWFLSHQARSRIESSKPATDDQYPSALRWK